MFQLPMTPLGTFKIILEIYEDKGYNRIEMLPQPFLDLQGTPNLIVYHAVNASGQILQYLAHEPDKNWVEYDPKRHNENFAAKPKPAPKPAPPIVTKPDHSTCKPPVDRKFESERQQPEPIKKRKPIPKAGPDSVRVESDSSPKGGKVVTAKVSNHVEPKQNLT